MTIGIQKRGRSKNKIDEKKKCLNKCRFKSQLNNFRIPIGKTP